MEVNLRRLRDRAPEGAISKTAAVPSVRASAGDNACAW
eukprot:CAMPEP_0183516164 /NCGR_PEP_ID=MMETSP0371-20130417/13996_1 /TAXON_ID=268820 /ORGANISM="Peridinium aciculiferum, Strain PAER-2" /LENGTH=37 /DNA_ID= /DNA_START= /DNA_END= /DNA_ORIENTATION=